MIRWTCVILLSMLTLAIATGWGLSKTRGEPLYPYREYSDNASVMIAFEGGQVRLSHWWYYDNIRSAFTATREALGFGYYVHRIDTPHRVTLQIHRVWFPAVIAVSVFGAYPSFVILSAIARYIHRRRRHGCRKCGYTLVGLSEPRCPECGSDVIIPAGVDVEQYDEPLPRAGVRTVAVTLAIFAALGGGLLFLTTDAYRRMVSPTRQRNTANQTNVLTPAMTQALLKALESSSSREEFKATREYKMWMQLRQLSPPAPLAGTVLPSLPTVAFPLTPTRPVPSPVVGHGSGCPRCGMHSDLVKVNLPETHWISLPPPKSENPPTEDMVWMCTECREFMVNPWTGNEHPEHDWCASCGYSTEDENGARIPWPSCLCPSCGTRHWP